MSLENSHSLFAGPLYIDPMYGASCVPTLYKTIVGNVVSEKTEQERIEAVTSIQANANVDSQTNKVVVLDFNQPVVKYTYGGWLGTQSYINILNSYLNDPTVAGIVLKIDSGGGQVYGTGEFYDFLKDTSKPIVAYTGGYLCSAAYYMAAPLAWIVANKRADAIGSIGAYATIVDSNGIYEHFGAKVHTMYASKSKGKNSAYREVIENSNYEPYIKEELDPIVEDFIADMKAVRPQLSEEVFDGSAWNGANSLDKGLVDELGTLQTAIDKVFALASENNQSNINTNMSTERTQVQAVLGLDAPLAVNENGSYLNDAQLDTMESHLSTQAETIAELNTQLEAAQENPELQDQLTVATEAASATEVSLDAMLTEAGLAVEGTVTEKLTALSAKVAVMANADGATHTIPKIDATVESATAVSIDANASHNQIADQI